MFQHRENKEHEGGKSSATLPPVVIPAGPSIHIKHPDIDAYITLRNK